MARTNGFWSTSGAMGISQLLGRPARNGCLLYTSFYDPIRKKPASFDAGFFVISMSGFPKAVTAARQRMKGLIVNYTPGLIPLYLENQRVRQPHRTLQQVQAALPASLAKEIFPPCGVVALSLIHI